MPNANVVVVGAHLLFGQRVRTARVYHRRLSQREFCVQAQVAPDTLSKVEQGVCSPWDEATVRRVAAVLEQDAEELLALARAWAPPGCAASPQEARVATIAGCAGNRPCLLCGAVITDAHVYHETGGGRVICAQHLADPAHYWTIRGEGSQ